MLFSKAFRTPQEYRSAAFSRAKTLQRGASDETFPVWPLTIRLPSKLGKNRVFREMATSWTTTGLHRSENISFFRQREYTQRSAAVDPGLCLNPFGQNDRKGRPPAPPGVLATPGRPADHPARLAADAAAPSNSSASPRPLASPAQSGESPGGLPSRPRGRGQVWVAERVLRQLGPDWGECFAA